MCTTIQVHYSQLSALWDTLTGCTSKKVAGLFLSTNFARTAWLVISKKEICGNLETRVPYFMVTHQYDCFWGILFAVCHDCLVPITRYFWRLHLESGLCPHLPLSGRTRVLRKKLPSSHRCSWTSLQSLYWSGLNSETLERQNPPIFSAGSFLWYHLLALWWFSLWLDQWDV